MLLPTSLLSLMMVVSQGSAMRVSSSESGLVTPRAAAPSLTVIPHETSVDISFFVIGIDWTPDTDYTLNIYQGNDNTDDNLCTSPFKCSPGAAVCEINSESLCGPLPSCENIFVEVSNGATTINKKSKTECPTLVCVPECPTDDMTNIQWINGEAYVLFFNDYYTWEEAQQICLSEGLILGEPRDNAKEVVAFLDRHFNWEFWMGARGDSNNTFHWDSDGTVLPSSSELWQPGVGPGEHCQDGSDCCLYSHTMEYPYDAYPCSWARHVLCQCP